MDVPVIEQIKIQAQVLVPLVKALQRELGKERAGSAGGYFSTPGDPEASRTSVYGFLEALRMASMESCPSSTTRIAHAHQQHRAACRENAWQLGAQDAQPLPHGNATFQEEGGGSD